MAAATPTAMGLGGLAHDRQAQARARQATRVVVGDRSVYAWVRAHGKVVRLAGSGSGGTTLYYFA